MDAVEAVTDNGVCWLRLNRPGKLNALNTEIRDGLRRELSRLEDDPDTRVVVVSGQGRAFSAGADLAELGQTPASVTLAQLRHGAGQWQRVLDQLERIPQATVASLHGHCIGGAALIAVACDLRIGADDLQVRIPELELGIPLTWGGIPRLQREIGLPLTRDLVMTGRALNAQQALEAGFIQRLVTLDHLEDETGKLVAELIDMPVAPLAMTRAALSAISRHEVARTSWADSDLLLWSRQAAAES